MMTPRHTTTEARETGGVATFARKEQSSMPLIAVPGLTAQSSLPSDALTFALQWFVGCWLAACLGWLATLFIFRRRGKRQSAYRGTLFLAIFLVTLAADNLVIAARAFIPVNPLVFTPVQALFLLYFMYFPDRRFAPRWTLWLAAIYTFSLLALFTTPTSQPSASQPPADIAWLRTPPPGTVGVLTILGYAFAAVPVFLVLLPQIALRFRRFTATSGPPQATAQAQRLALGAGLALASFALFFVSGLLSLPTQQKLPVAFAPPLICAQVAFFLLLTLIPASSGFALLRGWRLDTTALVRRARAYGSLSLALLLIYAACATAVWLAFRNNRVIPTIGYLPYLVIIVIIMTAVFRSLRAFIWRAIDQRFYRARYDAEQMLTTFSASLREETQLEPLSKRAVELIQKAMRPSATTLWLRGAPGLLAYRPANALANALTRGERTPQTQSVGPASGLLLRRQATTLAAATTPSEVVIADDDPARASLLHASSVEQIDHLPADSATGRALRDDGAAIILPLVSGGDLIGLLTLGQRQSGRPLHHG